MYVSRIILTNWRNFTKVDISLGERVFLVGPNASGKSNLIDAFRFLQDIAKTKGGGLQQALDARGGLSKIRCLAARKNPKVEIEIHVSMTIGAPPAWRYAIGIRRENRGKRYDLLAYEKVWRGTDDTPILNRPNEGDGKDDSRLTQTHLEQISSNAEFRELSDFFSSFSYLHLVPQLVRHPRFFTGPEIPGDPFGRGFMDKLATTPKKVRDSRLHKIESVLSRVLPKLKNLIYLQDLSGVPHLEAVYEHWRPGAGRQRETDFSDGTLRLIGLFWSMLEGDSLLLLEEPELSLNSSIVAQLARIIWKMQVLKKRQVIISTHSADLLSDRSIDGREVVLLMPEDEGTRVQVAASIKEVKALLEQGMSAAEVVLPLTAPKLAGSIGRQLTIFE